MIMEKKRIYALDIVRGISAILIVLYHYTTRYNESIYTIEEYKSNWPITVPWGCLAVCTFFLLSGYLSGVYQQGNVVKYLKKRFIRIWPIFAVCCLFTSVCMKLFYRQAFVGWKITLYNMTMLPILCGGMLVDGVYWTLQYEIFFYFIIAVLYILTPKRAIKKLILMTWLIASIIWFYSSMSGIIASLFNILLMPKYIGTFIIGISLREYINKESDKMDVILIILSVFNMSIWGSKGIVFFTIISAFTILGLVKNNLKINNENPIVKIFEFVAAISYPLYLCHQMIGYSIIYYLHKIGLESEWYILIPIIIAICIATIIHNFIEVPVTKVRL